jgi:branched-chain amino acid aminotransferase
MDPHIRVHGLAPGLNYGQQAYEGLKAFRTPSNNIHVFRPDFHATRLAHSAAFVCMPSPSHELFKECIRLAIVRNAEYVPPADPAVGGFLYVRPVLFGSSAQLALMPPDEFVFAVYVAPARPYHGSAALDALVLEDFDRAAPRELVARN